MNNLFRGLLAGAGAAKFGGGCLGTILVFAIIWALLGTCDGGSHAYLKKSRNTEVTVCASPSYSSTGTVMLNLRPKALANASLPQ